MNDQQKDALRAAADFLLRSADARPLPPNPPMPAIERGRQIKADGDMERVRELLTALVRWTRDGGCTYASAEKAAEVLQGTADYLTGKENADVLFDNAYHRFICDGLIKPF